MSDYKHSKQGWNAQHKMKEMKDDDMMYMLVRDMDAVAEKYVPYDHSARTSRSASKATSSVDNNEHDARSAASVDSTSFGPGSGTQPGANTPILGFLSFMPTFDDPPNEDRPVIYIYEIHLAQELRGGGLGKHMIMLVERIAKRVKLSKVMLTVFTRNTKAMAFYKSLGYTTDECSPSSSVGRTRKTRSMKAVAKVVEADYQILSKELEVDEHAEEAADVEGEDE